jgi:hypothetical protein
MNCIWPVDIMDIHFVYSKKYKGENLRFYLLIMWGTQLPLQTEFLTGTSTRKTGIVRTTLRRVRVTIVTVEQQ